MQVHVQMQMQKMQTDADGQSTRPDATLTNDPDEDKTTVSPPYPVKPEFKTSNSDAVHANCIFKLKIRGLDLDGSIRILGMSVCQFPIWHRCLALGGVAGRLAEVGGRGSRRARPKATLGSAWPAQLPWVPLGSIGSGRRWAPTAAATSGARRTCPAAAGEAQADRQSPHPASLVALACVVMGRVSV